MKNQLFAVVAILFSLLTSIPARAVTLDVTGMSCTLLAPCSTGLRNGTLDPSLMVTGQLSGPLSRSVIATPLDWGNEMFVNTLTLTGRGLVTVTWSQVGQGIIDAFSVILTGGTKTYALGDIYSSFFSGTSQGMDTAILSLSYAGRNSATWSFQGTVANTYCFEPGGVCDLALNNPTPAPVPLAATGLLMLSGLLTLGGMRRLRRRTT